MQMHPRTLRETKPAERIDFDRNATMSEEDLKVRDDLTIPGWELWFTASGSGGPGGQHANTTNSAVTLHWSVADSSVLEADQKKRIRNNLKRNITQEGVVQVSASDSRSQHRNRKIARERMAEQVAEAVEKTKRRIPTKPPKSADRRRLRNKRHRSRIKKLRQDPDPKDW